jgi:2,3-bisphosphoglycerate-independent phosphoglycerate mutase
MGNSEVGHTNIGAGFVVYQWLTPHRRRPGVRRARRNPTLLAIVDGCIQAGSTLHLAGLVGDGGVHSHTPT